MLVLATRLKAIEADITNNVTKIRIISHCCPIIKNPATTRLGGRVLRKGLPMEQSAPLARYALHWKDCAEPVSGRTETTAAAALQDLHGSTDSGRSSGSGRTVDAPPWAPDPPPSGQPPERPQQRRRRVHSGWAPGLGGRARAWHQGQSRSLHRWRHLTSWAPSSSELCLVLL